METGERVLPFEHSTHCGVMEITSTGRICWATDGGWQLLSDYCACHGQRPTHLPVTLRDWICCQTDISGQMREYHPFSSRVITSNENQLVVRLVQDSNRLFLLLEERCLKLSLAPLEQVGLTLREAEVLTWIMEGKSNGDIGTILDISPRTVQKHIEHIYEKLGVETRVAAASRARELLHGDGGEHAGPAITSRTQMSGLYGGFLPERV